MLETILEVYELYGFQSAGYSLTKTARHWSNLLEKSDGKWIALAKYKLAAFFSVQLSQKDLPKAPFAPIVGLDNPSILLGGTAYRWCRAFLRDSPEDRRFSFLASILYSKYGMPLPGKADIEAEVRDTVDFLTRDHPELNSMRHLPAENFGAGFFGRGGRSVFPRQPETLKAPFLGEGAAPCEKPNPGNFVGADELGWNVLPVEMNLPFQLSKEAYRRQLERTVDELFPPLDAYKARKVWEEDIDIDRPRFPSTNSNYNLSRTAGGAVGSILMEAGSAGLVADQRLLVGKWHRCHKVRDIERMRFTEGDVSKLDTTDLEGRSTYLDQIPAPPLTVAELAAAQSRLEDDDDFRPLTDQVWRPRDLMGWVFVVDDSALRAKSTILWSKVIADAEDEAPLVEPVGLAEALKVRVITKGPPLTYSALKPLQKYLHSVLRQHPCFALIGEEIEATHIHMRMGDRLREDEFYTSGDYKASTNYLDPDVSEVIVRRICSNLQLPFIVAQLFLRSLTHHVFVEGADTKLEQRWGQLMGSIMSFPILCIANAAMCRWAIEYGRRQLVTLRDAPLSVNGDDCIFKCNVWSLEAWKSITAGAGLVPSVGKVYTSRSYLNMNSTSFRRLETPVEADFPDLRHTGQSVRRLCRFERIPFVNLRLMSNAKRSQIVGPTVDKEIPLGERARELLRRCPDHLRMPVMKRFLNRNWKRLSAVRVPWFMPEWIGGLGLPWILNGDVDEPVGDGYGPTKLDLQKAHWILRNWSKHRPARVPPAASWKVHEHVKSRLPVQPVETTLPVDTSGYDHLYGSLCAESLFRAEEGLPDLLDPEGPRTIGKQVLRQNERLWAKAQVCGEPLSLQRCLPRRTYTFLPISFKT